MSEPSPDRPPARPPIQCAVPPESRPAAQAHGPAPLTPFTGPQDPQTTQFTIVDLLRMMTAAGVAFGCGVLGQEFPYAWLVSIAAGVVFFTELPPAALRLLLWLIFIAAVTILGAAVFTLVLAPFAR